MSTRQVDVDPLCCCEYYNNEGERSHLLALCCDCEALDLAVDKMFSGREVEKETIEAIFDVIEERIRVPWIKGAQKIPLGSLLPLILVPTFLWLASLHYYTTLIVLLILLPSLFLFGLRTVVRYRPKTKFFYAWSCTTAAYLFYIYEVKCVGLFWDLPKVISWWENLVFIGASGTSLKD